MRKLVLFLFALATLSSQAMVISLINHTDSPVTMSAPSGELVTVDPGSTNEIAVPSAGFMATFSQPFDDSLGFAPATTEFLNWMNDYSIVVTRVRVWNDPSKLLRANVRATHVEYVTVVNSTTEDIRVIDMRTHRLLGVIANVNNEEGLNYQTFRFVNKVNLMFRQTNTPTSRGIPTGHVNIPLSGFWNVNVTQPTGFRLRNGDVLKTEIVPAE